jgi:hypothetical protein
MILSNYERKWDSTAPVKRRRGRWFPFAIPTVYFNNHVVGYEWYYKFDRYITRLVALWCGNKTNWKINWESSLWFVFSTHKIRQDPCHST